jgi:hypothetical protein
MTAEIAIGSGEVARFQRAAARVAPAKNPTGFRVEQSVEVDLRRGLDLGA